MTRAIVLSTLVLLWLLMTVPRADAPAGKPAAPAPPPPPQSVQTQPAGSPGKPHLFIYLIDGFRALDLPAYGFPEMTAPVLRDMMEEGVSFTRQYAVSPWSVPSLASAFTSLYPATHGVIKAGQRLPESATTLAEILKEAGYDTALFTSHPLLGSLTGLSQGFEHVEEVEGPFYPSPARSPAQTSSTLNRRLLGWLEKRTSRAPVFAVVVSSDLMEPFGAPAPEGTRYLDTGELAWYSGIRKKLLALRPGPLSPATGGDLAKLKVDPARFARAAQHLYDGAIYYNDSQLRLLRRELEARGLLQQSLFLVTSTRGEEFLDHGLFGHGTSLYDSSVLIPWILTRPGAPSPDQVHKPTDNVDLMPTLLGILQIAPPTNLQGSDRMRRPDQQTRRLAERPAFADASPAGDASTGTMSMMAEGGSKLIAYDELPFGVDRPVVELFRREASEVGWEKKNLAGGVPELMSDRREKLDAWKNRCESARPASDPPPLAPDPRLKEVLRALGYLKAPS